MDFLQEAVALKQGELEDEERRLGEAGDVKERLRSQKVGGEHADDVPLLR